MAAGTKTLGLLINPVAGLGGRVGLKGSDGVEVVDEALALGATPEAPRRAGYALDELSPMKERLLIYTYGGEMGENLLKTKDFAYKVVGWPDQERTTAEDTLKAVKLLEEAGVELLLFAGGDGTARNVSEVIGDRVPVIGIPAGVKIHSAVYATNARNAGLVALDYLEGMSREVQPKEVMDIDETLFRQGRLSAKLYSYMLVPVSGDRVQQTKSTGISQQEELMGVVGHVVTRMEEDTLYIVGPGTTTQAVMDELGVEGTLLGVDVVQNGQLVARDVSESKLWSLISDPAQPVRILVTIIGGQGNLFGRGNQQISPRILRRVGKSNIIVIATASKLNALYGQPLLVDTGDPALDAELAGYIEVVKDFAFTSVYPVSG